MRFKDMGFKDMSLKLKLKDGTHIDVRFWSFFVLWFACYAALVLIILIAAIVFGLNGLY